MSHFTVGIIRKRTQRIEDLLAPYNENMEVEDYISDTREEIIEQARESLLKSKELYERGGHLNPEWYEKNALPYIDAALNNDEEKLFEYGTRYDEPEYIDEQGNRHSTYNPLSKWDWYVIGGRWRGTLKTKKGSFVNSGIIKNLDFSPDEETLREAKRFWDVYVEGEKAEEGEELFSLWKPEYYKEKYGTKEEYAKRQAAFTTFAVITPDGEWHEQGQMGWFGCSSDTPEEAKDWDDSYYDRFVGNPEYQNCYFTLVDCHI